MAESKGAVYYGRYVDDMILVTEIENTDTFKENILSKGNQYVCNYMIELLEDSNVIKNNNNGKYLLSGFSKLNFQKSKLRFFYIDKDGYNTIIEKYKMIFVRMQVNLIIYPKTQLKN